MASFKFLLVLIGLGGIAEFLIQRGADKSAENDYYGNPLFCAVRWGRNFGLVRKLIEVHGLNANPGGNWDIMKSACEGRSKEAVEYLLNKYKRNVLARDAKGRSLLHEACRWRSLDVVKYLISLGCDIQARDLDGDTLVHEACGAIRSLDVLQFLVEEKKLNLDAVNNKGLTPLHIASDSLNIERMRYIVEIRKQKIEVIDSEGRTPLHSACSWAHQGHFETVQYLLSQGAKITEKLNAYLRENKREMDSKVLALFPSMA